MKVWTRLIIWIGVACFSLGGLYFGLTSSLFVINRVQIKLDKDSREESLFRIIKKDMAIDAQALIGKLIWSTSLEQLLERVQKDARISNIFIEKKYPSTLSLRIVPRKPIALFVDEKGKLFPLGSDGEFLPYIESAVHYDLPILRGKIFLSQKSRRLEIVRMLVGLPQEGDFIAKNISEIHFSKESDYELYLEKSDAIVKIKIDGFAYKASMVLRVLKYLNTHNLKGRVIDARFSKKVVVRLRNES